MIIADNIIQAKYWNFLRLAYLNLSLAHRVKYYLTPIYFIEENCIALTRNHYYNKPRLTSLHTIIKAISTLLIFIINNLLISFFKIKLLKIYQSGF